MPVDKPGSFVGVSTLQVLREREFLSRKVKIIQRAWKEYKSLRLQDAHYKALCRQREGRYRRSCYMIKKATRLELDPVVTHALNEALRDYTVIFKDATVPLKQQKKQGLTEISASGILESTKSSRGRPLQDKTIVDFLEVKVGVLRASMQ